MILRFFFWNITNQLLEYEQKQLICHSNGSLVHLNIETKNSGLNVLHQNKNSYIYVKGITQWNNQEHLQNSTF